MTLLKIVSICFIIFLLWGYGTSQSKQIVNPGFQFDLSGNWNITNANVIAEDMTSDYIQECRDAIKQSAIWLNVDEVSKEILSSITRELYNEVFPITNDDQSVVSMINNMMKPLELSRVRAGIINFGLKVES